MVIAEKKRKENISEYIIFMYQTEDLVRAYQFNLEEIEKYVINHFPIEDKNKAEVKAWYGKVIEQMKTEGIEKEGHLRETVDIVKELSDLNRELLKSDKNYRSIYDQAKLHIKKHLELSEGKVTDGIQICINGIYGLMLLRLNGKKVEESQKASLNSFGDVLSYLSFKYKKRRAINQN
ncbi:DUF4924 family protein [Xanthovirga aplysinae]|uniref:DUF4924 family protein n=1 Tax=Xanthovirga aplysinae TaxID=2529853 RepID=UPI0012BBED31|nr:DUF4924 family protein [Xanthovirga aplysinae]MTI32038.1 DUF4924 family protein [Xanthovirga aplysinae]